jgi:cytochrome b561
MTGASRILTRRRLTILLHWGVVFAVLAMIEGGTQTPALRWGFVGAALLWVSLAVIIGGQAKPGPKLRGRLRTAFPWMHRGMFALVGVAAVLNLCALLGWTPLVWAWNSLLVVLAAGTFHGIFHLWRHTSLNDGALRMITPKFWHKYL